MESLKASQVNLENIKIQLEDERSKYAEAKREFEKHQNELTAKCSQLATEFNELELSVCFSI